MCTEGDIGEPGWGIGHVCGLGRRAGGQEQHLAGGETAAEGTLLSRRQCWTDWLAYA